MKNQYRTGQDSSSSFSVVLIPVIAGIITLFMIMLYNNKPPVVFAKTEPPVVAAPVVIVEAEPAPEPEVIAEPAGECMLLTPPEELTGPFQEALYNYQGERDLVTLPNKINEDQAVLLEYAFNIAKADGHNDPSILQGLIWQESKAGGYPGYEVAGDEYGLKVGKRYYGIGQIKVSAAKDVFKRFPKDFPEFYQPRVREKQANGKMKTVVKAKYLKTDDEIIAYLIMDHKFNIRVASKYLWMMGHNETKKPTFIRPTNYAITAYNRGLGNTYDTDYDNWHYTVGVHKHKDTFIKTFNLANNIK